eukprot:SAG22_NODE_2896_length_2119_cov_1.382673_3_plen_111_part_00
MSLIKAHVTSAEMRLDTSETKGAKTFLTIEDTSSGQAKQGMSVRQRILASQFGGDSGGTNVKRVLVRDGKVVQNKNAAPPPPGMFAAKKERTNDPLDWAGDVDLDDEEAW